MYDYKILCCKPAVLTELPIAQLFFIVETCCYIIFLIFVLVCFFFKRIASIDADIPKVLESPSKDNVRTVHALSKRSWNPVVHNRITDAINSSFGLFF